MPYLTQRHVRRSGAEEFWGLENRTERKIRQFKYSYQPPKI